MRCACSPTASRGGKSGLSNKPIFPHSLCLSKQNHTAKNPKLMQVEHTCSPPASQQLFPNHRQTHGQANPEAALLTLLSQHARPAIQLNGKLPQAYEFNQTPILWIIGRTSLSSQLEYVDIHTDGTGSRGSRPEPILQLRIRFHITP